MSAIKELEVLIYESESKRVTIPSRLKEKARLEYEEKINESQFFTIDKTKDEILWEREKKKLISVITDYYKNVVWYNKNQKSTSSDGKNQKDKAKVPMFEACAFSLVMSISATLKSYKKENGVYLHYLNKVLSLEVRKEVVKADVANARGGMKVDVQTDKNIRTIYKYKKACKHLDDESSNVEMVEYIKKASGLSEAEVNKYLTINQELSVKRDATCSGDGEDDNDGASIFDKVADCTDIVTTFEVEDTINSWLKIMQEEYVKTQERSKKLISALLTTRLLAELPDSVACNLDRYSFCNKKFYLAHQAKRKLPSEKIICEKIGVLPASGSRTIDTFLKRCKAKIDDNT